MTPPTDKSDDLRRKLEPIVFPYFKHDELVTSQQILLDSVIELLSDHITAQNNTTYEAVMEAIDTNDPQTGRLTGKYYWGNTLRQSIAKIFGKESSDE